MGPNKSFGVSKYQTVLSTQRRQQTPMKVVFPQAKQARLFTIVQPCMQAVSLHVKSAVSQVKTYRKKSYRNHLWLTETSVRPVYYQRSPTQKIGPGSYNILQNKKLGGGQFSTLQRFGQQNEMSEHIGPGYYTTLRPQSLGNAMSQTRAKTYIDQVYEKQAKFHTPGPGSYDYRPKSKSNTTAVGFRSKRGRFAQRNNDHQTLQWSNVNVQLKKIDRLNTQPKPELTPVQSNHVTYRGKVQSQYETGSLVPGSYSNMVTLSRYLRRKYNKGLKGRVDCQRNRLITNKSTSSPSRRRHGLLRQTQIQALAATRPTTFLAPCRYFQTLKMKTLNLDPFGTQIPFGTGKRHPNLNNKSGPERDLVYRTNTQEH